MADHPLLNRVVVRSRFLEVLLLDTGNALCVQTLLQARLVLKPEAVAVLDAFEAPRRVGEWLAASGVLAESESEARLAAVSSLLANGMLFAGTPEEERARCEILGAHR